MSVEYTPAYLNYGLGTAVKMVENDTKIIETARWVGTYKLGVDHAVYENLGKGDREFEVKGGPINATEDGYIRGFIEGTATVKFRCSRTANADIDVIVLSHEAQYHSFISGAIQLQGKANVDGVTGRNIHVLLRLRESL